MQEPTALNNLSPALDQEAFKRALSAAYGLNANTIRFDERGKATLEHNDMQVVVQDLMPELISDDINFVRYVEETGEVVCEATLRLINGRTVTRQGITFVGESLGEDKQVERVQQAIAIANARAYRAALLALGFDLVRAFLAKQMKAQPAATIVAIDKSIEGQRSQLHSVARNIGLLTNEDRALYVKWLQANFGEHITSSAQLNTAQVNAALSLLLARDSARGWALNHAQAA